MTGYEGKTRTYKDLATKDKDKDKDLSSKDKDKDKDLKFVLKDSLRTRTNITGIYDYNKCT